MRRSRSAALLLAVLLIGCSAEVTARSQPGSTATDRVPPAVAGTSSTSDSALGARPTNPAISGGSTSSVDDSPRPSGVLVAHVKPAVIVARAEPDERAAVVTEMSNPTDMGGPLVFQLVETTVPDPGGWVEVHLPVRPNGTTGWVKGDQLTLSSNPYRIEVSTSEYRLRVFKDDALWLDAEVAIGTGATPTPLGQFYIIELLKPPTADGIYGSFAFGLSGFSETLTSFAGGEGVIGIHGTNNPDALGSDVSHGCVRVANETIEALAGVIPLGTPVVIEA
ncbi:MAG: L,D-transpeptidase [Acidimicrobiales bacterium]